MDRQKAIGVVGGVGPYAGLDLVRKIFDQTVASSDQDHLPVFLISLPADIEDRTEFLLRNSGKNPGHSISSILKKLEAAGASVAGIPCNTAHAPQIYSVVVQDLAARKSNLKLLSLIDETIGVIQSRRPKPGRVGILSTTGTRKTKIYRDPLEQNGFQVVEPPDDAQADLIQDAIYNRSYGIKAQSNPVTERARGQVMKGLDLLVHQNVDVIILGCTELPLAVPEPWFKGIQLIDPSTLLARSLIMEIDPSKLKHGANERAHSPEFSPL